MELKHSHRESKPATASSAQSPQTFHEAEDPFSSLTLLDPTHEISQSSKEAGRAAGRETSYREGRDIGRTKGWEVGLELGYMSSFCGEILNGLETLQQCDSQFSNVTHDSEDIVDNNVTESERNNGQIAESNPSSSSSRTNSRLTRCATLAREIVKLIEDFPPPEHLLHDNQNEFDDAANNTTQQSNSNVTTSLDISTSIQRIRAKFKLFTVLLKTGQSFDIKRILEKGATDDGVVDDGNRVTGELTDNDAGREKNNVVNVGGDW